MVRTHIGLVSAFCHNWVSYTNYSTEGERLGHCPRFHKGTLSFPTVSMVSLPRFNVPRPLPNPKPLPNSRLSTHFHTQPFIFRVVSTIRGGPKSATNLGNNKEAKVRGPGSVVTYNEALGPMPTQAPPQTFAEVIPSSSDFATSSLSENNSTSELDNCSLLKPKLLSSSSSNTAQAKGSCRRKKCIWALHKFKFDKWCFCG